MSAPGPARATDSATTRLDWETPLPFFAWRDSIWKFDVDAAASADNHLCPFWFGPESPKRIVDRDAPIDALARDLDWSEYGDRFWCNPPYGREIERWVKCFARQAIENRVFIEVLIPANTGTRWFEYCASTAQEIDLLTGRIEFHINGEPVVDANGRKSGNTSDSMLVRWHPGGRYRGARIGLVDWQEEMKRGQ